MAWLAATIQICGLKIPNSRPEALSAALFKEPGGTP